jgi:hypothetical protein
MSRPLPELVAAWEAAEARLYPIVMTRPEVYGRALSVVREIVAELAPYGTVEGLAGAFDRAAEIAGQAIERSGVPTDGVDLGLAAGCAFALRYRAVLAAAARAASLTRIEEARASGQAWVLIAESGDPDAGPFHRVELHLGQGVCVQRTIGLDAEMGAPTFAVEAFAADPRTGDRLGDAEPVVPAAEYGSRREWEEAVERVRRAVAEARG